jgi:uncharacterized protein (TIGR02217 family)
MFIEQRLPDVIAFGAVGGPRFLTSVGTSASGFEARADLWTIERGMWDLGYFNRSEEETKALIAFFVAVARGRANGFRFLDHAEGESTGVSEYLGTGDGADATFQLRKAYTQGGETYYRTIYKPVAGTVTATLNGTATTAFTVSTTTGIVTFTSPPGGGVVVRASFQFDVPVRFDVDWLSLRCVEPGVCSWEGVTLSEIRDIA